MPRIRVGKDSCVQTFMMVSKQKAPATVASSTEDSTVAKVNPNNTGMRLENTISLPRLSSVAASEMLAKATGRSAPTPRPMTAIPRNMIPKFNERNGAMDPSTMRTIVTRNTVRRPNRSPSRPPSNEPTATPSARAAVRNPTSLALSPGWPGSIDWNSTSAMPIPVVAASTNVAMPQTNATHHG